MVAFHAMPLITHLRGDLVVPRHFTQFAGLRDVMADGLLAINCFAKLHGDHRWQRVLVVGGSDENCVDLFANFVKHLPVIEESLKLVGFIVFVFEPFLGKCL